MIKVTVSASSVSKLKKRVEDAKTKINQTLLSVSQLETNAVKKRIQSSKLSPDNIPWQPWKLSTLRQRTREGNVARGLLYRTGALLNGIRGMVNGNKIRITSDAPYSSRLQFGTSKMVARAFMGWDRETLNILRNRIKDSFK